MCYVVLSFWGALNSERLRELLCRSEKSTTLQNVPWLCASIQEESWAMASWSSTATYAVNIA